MSPPAPSPITVRAATERDGAAVAALIAAAATARGRPVPPGEARSRAMAGLSRTGEPAFALALVAGRPGGLAGFAAGEDGDGPALRCGLLHAAPGDEAALIALLEWLAARAAEAGTGLVVDAPPPVAAAWLLARGGARVEALALAPGEVRGAVAVDSAPRREHPGAAPRER